MDHTGFIEVDDILNIPNPNDPNGLPWLLFSEDYKAELKRWEKPVDHEKEARELRAIIEEFEQRIHG